jgi:hypothetical protein
MKFDTKDLELIEEVEAELRTARPPFTPEQRRRQKPSSNIARTNGWRSIRKRGSSRSAQRGGQKPS